jgi:hypothetical protein
VSTNKLRNRRTEDYPVNIVERSSIPITSASDLRIKAFLKGLRESEEREEVDVEWRDKFKHSF